MTSNAAIPPLPLEHCRFAVVDVETTGTKAPPAGGGRILEVAVAILEGGTVHLGFGDALATTYILRSLLWRARERGVETLEELRELHDRPRHRLPISIPS